MRNPRIETPKWERDKKKETVTGTGGLPGNRREAEGTVFRSPSDRDASRIKLRTGRSGGGKTGGRWLLEKNSKGKKKKKKKKTHSRSKETGGQKRQGPVEVTFEKRDSESRKGRGDSDKMTLGQCLRKRREPKRELKKRGRSKQEEGQSEPRNQFGPLIWKIIVHRKRKRLRKRSRPWTDLARETKGDKGDLFRTSTTDMVGHQTPARGRKKRRGGKRGNQGQKKRKKGAEKEAEDSNPGRAPIVLERKGTEGGVRLETQKKYKKGQPKGRLGTLR